MQFELQGDVNPVVEDGKTYVYDGHLGEFILVVDSTAVEEMEVEEMVGFEAPADMEPLVEVEDGNLYIYDDHTKDFELVVDATAIEEMKVEEMIEDVAFVDPFEVEV